MELNSKVLEEYANTRWGTYKSVVCHAPYVSLNFEQNGNVRACCYNNKDILGVWPQQSILEIWKGAEANKLRQNILNNNLGGGCYECGNMIIAGNYQGVRAKFFDEFAPNNLSTRFNYLRNKLTGQLNYPKVLEFELSSECNLECVMCNGYFSSSIRKNREQLPPIISPYNDKFVDELEEFIPHITDAKFLGGEPFMIKIYLKIWERIMKINPSVRIHITTNGTFMTNRVKELLEGLKAGIIISIDSINEETYNKIRINGNFQKVMENLDYIIDYTKRKRTFISIAACPITLNWHEMPSILEFCLSKNIALYFNAVFTPVELSLREQPLEELQKMIQFLESHPIPEKKGSFRSPRNLSISAYLDFIKLLKGWKKTRESQLLEKKERLQEVAKSEYFESSLSIEEAKWSEDELLQIVIQLSDLEGKGFFAKEKEMQGNLESILIGSTLDQLQMVFNIYLELYCNFNKISKPGNLREKAVFLANLIGKKPQRNLVLKQISKVPPLQLGELFFNQNLQELEGSLNAFLG